MLKLTQLPVWLLSLAMLNGASEALAAPFPEAEASGLPATTQIAQAGRRKAEADRLLQQGIQSYQRGQYREAVASWEQAIQLYREIGDRAEEGHTLNNLGVVYESVSQYQRAINFYQQSLVIFREIGDRAGEGRVLNNLGLVDQALGKYQQAIDFYQQSLVIFRETDDRAGESRTLNNLGLANQALSKYQQAINFYQQSLVISQEIGDRAGAGGSLGNLGGTYQALGKYQQAIDFYQQSLVILQEIGDRAGAGRVVGSLGDIYRDLGQYQRAIDFCQQSLVILQEIGDRAGESRTLNNLGLANQALSKYQQAINFYQQSLVISQEIGDRAGAGRALGNLGGTYQALGQYQRAIDFYKQSLVIFREIGNRAGAGRALNNLGLANQTLSKYQQAINFYQQSLVIFREIGDRTGEEETFRNLGSVSYRLGQYQQAIDFYQQSLTISQEISNPAGEVSNLVNLGVVYNDLEQYQRAIDFYQQSLTISREISNPAEEGLSLSGLGNVYQKLGKYQQAIDFYQQSLAIARGIGDRAGEGATLGNLGIAYQRLGKYEQAIDFWQQSLAISQEIGDRTGEGKVLHNLGSAYLLSQRPVAAEEVLTLAVDILDALRTVDLNDANKVALFETQQKTFFHLQRALVAQNKSEPALEIAERGRARAFAELIAQRLTPAESRANLEPASLASIKAFAQQQQLVLVEYSIIDFYGDNRDPLLYLWVISPDGTISFRQQSLGDINLSDLVTDTRQAIGVRGSRAAVVAQLKPEYVAQRQAETHRKLAQLHKLLIDPIADLLPTDPAQPVVFIPQKELFLVPFPALKDASGQYLIEKHTILTAPSIQVLQLTGNLAATSQVKSFRKGKALIVGNPAMPTVTFLDEDDQFSRVRLSSLAGAEREAAEIADFLNASPLIREHATEATVKQQMASADLIHLATHGLLEYGDPRETGSRDTPGAIALAPGSGEDGLLTSGEILQLDLQANLVVLSACDTGRGRLTGDGVIGLSRSFVAAGVPSIVVSLWQVPDAPTAELMTAFYRQLTAGQSKAQALRQAMLATMQTHPDPKNWAAFTLIGEAE